ncbi:MAG: hypothetical protein LBF16_09300 [Pseudomonadales bacterium]|jgi:hypothetical protein|nr:hypothetical protein [Pseudomonadales bacterium]
MKVTEYFRVASLRPDRALIRSEWINQVCNNPEHQRLQSDGRIRRWARIAQADGRWLRVVLLLGGQTIHNAFFDRRFKP